MNHITPDGDILTPEEYKQLLQITGKEVPLEKFIKKYENIKIPFDDTIHLFQHIEDTAYLGCTFAETVVPHYRDAFNLISNELKEYLDSRRKWSRFLHATDFVPVYVKTLKCIAEEPVDPITAAYSNIVNITRIYEEYSVTDDIDVITKSIIEKIESTSWFNDKLITEIAVKSITPANSNDCVYIVGVGVFDINKNNSLNTSRNYNFSGVLDDNTISKSYPNPTFIDRDVKLTTFYRKLRIAEKTSITLSANPFLNIWTPQKFNIEGKLSDIDTINATVLDDLTIRLEKYLNENPKVFVNTAAIIANSNVADSSKSVMIVCHYICPDFEEHRNVRTFIQNMLDETLANG